MPKVGQQTASVQHTSHRNSIYIVTRRSLRNMTAPLGARHARMPTCSRLLESGTHISSPNDSSPNIEDRPKYVQRALEAYLPCTGNAAGA